MMRCLPAWAARMACSAVLRGKAGHIDHVDFWILQHRFVSIVNPDRRPILRFQLGGRKGWPRGKINGANISQLGVANGVNVRGGGPPVTCDSDLVGLAHWGCIKAAQGASVNSMIIAKSQRPRHTPLARDNSH